MKKISYLLFQLHIFNYIDNEKDKEKTNAFEVYEFSLIY